MLSDNTLEQLTTDELNHICHSSEKVIERRYFFSRFNVDIFSDMFPNWEFIDYENDCVDDFKNNTNTKIIYIIHRDANSWTKTIYTCKVINNYSFQIFCNNNLEYKGNVSMFDKNYVYPNNTNNTNNKKYLADVLDKFSYIYSFTTI